jgi:hypothetical protein
VNPTLVHACGLLPKMTFNRDVSQQCGQSTASGNPHPLYGLSTPSGPAFLDVASLRIRPSNGPSRSAVEF